MGTGVGVLVDGGRGVFVGAGKAVFVGAGRAVSGGASEGFELGLGVGELQPRRAKPTAASATSTTSLTIRMFSSRVYRKIRVRP